MRRRPMAIRRTSHPQQRLLRDLAIIGYYGAVLATLAAVFVTMFILITVATPGGVRCAQQTTIGTCTPP
jgi:ABC-type proline/glycine betaine transport system permease subunit